jgi:enoyl-CoA hydratase/carnithine racemase
VATITLDAPQRHNALSEAAIAQLTGIVERLRDDDGVRAVIVTGAGDSFCSGGDLREFAVAEHLGHRYFETRAVARMYRAMAEVGRPTVAAVRGHCIGMGLGLALSCDLVVAADDAVFSAPEVEIGLFPFMIAPIIRRSVPRLAANGLILLNERISGERLLSYGLANRVVAADEVLDVAGQWAAALATAPAQMLRIGLDAQRHADGMAIADELEFMHSHLPVATVNGQTRDALGALLRAGERREEGA